MEALAWVGVVTSVFALAFALIALFRSVPPIGFEPLKGDSDLLDSWEVWNAGPGAIQIIDVYFEAPGGVFTVEDLESRFGWELVEERLRPGAVVPAGRRHFVRVESNSNLVIHYRAAGPFGLLSRAKMTIEGVV